MKSTSIVLNLTPVEVARLNLTCAVFGVTPTQHIQNILEDNFQGAKADILGFGARGKTFNEFRSIAGLKRVYRKRKARKVKGK